jgi:REP element-mobilizing transposase RayT
MPRHARIDQPGLLHHVIARGIEKRSIFLDDQDRESFVSRLGKELKSTDTDCYAWVLMDSHIHLLLRPRQLRLADFMRRLLTGHAVVFNLRHKRSGHLFQNRYKSIVCDQDAYLLELIRYIHLNPIRAGMLPTLEALDTYRWCGHCELLGKTARPLLEPREVLSHFSPNRNAALQKYREFMSDGLKGPVPDLSRGGKRTSLALDASLSEDDTFDERILGGGAFVDGLRLGNSGIAREKPMDFEELVARVTSHYQVAPERLALPDKERSLAKCKAVLCHVALRHLGMSGAEIGGRTALSPSGVTRAAQRGEGLLRTDESLRRLVGR